MWHSMGVMVDKTIPGDALVVIYDTESPVLDDAKKPPRYNTFMAGTNLWKCFDILKQKKVFRYCTRYFRVNGTSHKGEDHCNWYTFEWMCDMIINPIDFRNGCPAGYITCVI